MPIIPNDTPPPTPIPTPVPTLQDLVYRALVDNLGLILGIALVLAIIFLIIQIYLTKKAKKQLLFKDFSVGRYMVKMYRLIGDHYHEIDKKRIKITQGKFRYNNKDFTIFKINQIAFSDRKNNYYAFDYDSGDQLTFNKSKMPKDVSREDLDIYTNRGIIADLVKGLEDIKPKSQWILLIAGLVLGIGIGIIIGLYAFPHEATTTIINNATSTAKPDMFGVIHP